MAIVKGPLLSIDARGQIAKTLVYLGWKGLKTARQHVVPANPNTAAQQAQRTLVTDMVAAWKNYFTDATMRQAWNLLALVDAKPLSGFNSFGSNVIQVTSDDADASFAGTVTAAAAQKVTFGMLNCDDGVAGDEAGDFEIWVGDTKTDLVLDEEVAIAVGDVVGTSDLGDEGDIKYVKLRKGGYDRSGLCKITLAAS